MKNVLFSLVLTTVCLGASHGLQERQDRILESKPRLLALYSFDSPAGIPLAEHSDYKAHLEYVDTLCRAGHVSEYGRYQDLSGATIQFETSSREEVVELLQQDPIVRNGLGRYELKVWVARDCSMQKAIAGDLSMSVLEREGVRVVVEVVDPGKRVFAEGPEKGMPWKPESGGKFEFVDRKLAYTLCEYIPIELAELTNALKKRKSAHPSYTLAIDCLPGTTYGDMVPVLDAGIEAGFEDVTFVAEYKN